MSTILNLMAIEESIKNHFESDVDLKEEFEEVFLEPDDVNGVYPNISIFRKLAPFEMITTGRNFSVKPVISILCSVLNLDRSIVGAWKSLDSLVEKTLRSIKKNSRWQMNANVATSHPTSIEFNFGQREDSYIAVAQIDLELTIYYS